MRCLTVWQEHGLNKSICFVDDDQHAIPVTRQDKTWGDYAQRAIFLDHNDLQSWLLNAIKMILGGTRPDDLYRLAVEVDRLMALDRDDSEV